MLCILVSEFTHALKILLYDVIFQNVFSLGRYIGRSLNLLQMKYSGKIFNIHVLVISMIMIFHIRP